MGVKVYYSEISGSKEVKKRQQRVMMILESKGIPYEAIDITEAGRETDKDFMLSNAKPRGDTKIILSPQIFADEVYCGDYDDFDLANENDTLEEFLHSPKIEKLVISRGPSAEKSEPKAEAVVNGNATSRESSAEVESKKVVEDSKSKEASPEKDAKEASPVKEASPEKAVKEASPEKTVEEPPSEKSKEPSPEKQVESSEEKGDTSDEPKAEEPKGDESKEEAEEEEE